MSLWTPSGEHRVGAGKSVDAPTAGPGHGAGDTGPAAAPGHRGGSGGSGAGATATAAAGAEGGAQAAAEDLSGAGLTADDLASLRQQLAEAPAEVVVANHCYGLFELAALHLSGSPPGLDHARLAIDALGCLVDGLGEQLGEAYPALRDALAQIRLAYVQISTAGS